MKQIHCPHCRQLIDVENAFTHDLTQEFQAKLAEERKLVEAQAVEKNAERTGNA